jgi:hypothetical protein
MSVDCPLQHLLLARVQQQQPSAMTHHGTCKNIQQKRTLRHHKNHHFLTSTRAYLDMVKNYFL